MFTTRPWYSLYTKYQTSYFHKMQENRNSFISETNDFFAFLIFKAIIKACKQTGGKQTALQLPDTDKHLNYLQENRIYHPVLSLLNVADPYINEEAIPGTGFRQLAISDTPYSQFIRCLQSERMTTKVHRNEGWVNILTGRFDEKQEKYLKSSYLGYTKYTRYILYSVMKSRNFVLG